MTRASLVPDHPATGSVPKRFYSERDLSVYSGIAVRTLQSWRLRGIGPRWVKLGGAVRYDLADFDAWVATCEAGGGGAR